MEEKKQALYSAALRLLAHRRPSEITIAEIAREAGIGKGTVYEYFSSKEELFAHTVLYAAENNLAGMKALRLEGPFEQVCRRIFRRLRQDFMSSRLLLALLFQQEEDTWFSADFSREIAGELARLQQELALLLRRVEALGAAQGVVPGGCGEDDLMFAFCCVSGALCHQAILKKDGPEERYFSFCYRKLVQLLRPAPEK